MFRKNLRFDKTQIQVTAVGFVAGLAVASGGAIKDSPHEGFEHSKYLRSPVIAAIAANVIYTIYPNIEMPVLFLSSIALERIVVESWKLLRNQVPGKFEYGEWDNKKCCLCQK